MLKSKTFWGGIVSIVTGAGLIATGSTGEGVTAVLVGVQTIFLRHSINKGS